MLILPAVTAFLAFSAPTNAAPLSFFSAAARSVHFSFLQQPSRGHNHPIDTPTLEERQEEEQRGSQVTNTRTTTITEALETVVIFATVTETLNFIDPLQGQQLAVQTIIANAQEVVKRSPQHGDAPEGPATTPKVTLPSVRQTSLAPSSPHPTTDTKPEQVQNEAHFKRQEGCAGLTRCGPPPGVTETVDVTETVTETVSTIFTTTVTRTVFVTVTRAPAATTTVFTTTTVFLPPDDATTTATGGDDDSGDDDTDGPTGTADDGAEPTGPPGDGSDDPPSTTDDTSPDDPAPTSPDDTDPSEPTPTGTDTAPTESDPATSDPTTSVTSSQPTTSESPSPTTDATTSTSEPSATTETEEPTSPTSPTPTESPPGSASGVRLGSDEIAAIIAGFSILLLIILVLAIMLWLRRRERRDTASPDREMPERPARPSAITGGSTDRDSSLASEILGQPAVIVPGRTSRPPHSQVRIPIRPYPKRRTLSSELSPFGYMGREGNGNGNGGRSLPDSRASMYVSPRDSDEEQGGIQHGNDRAGPSDTVGRVTPMAYPGHI